MDGFDARRSSSPRRLLLHRHAGKGRAGGKLVAYDFRNVAHRDLNRHAVIMMLALS